MQLSLRIYKYCRSVFWLCLLSLMFQSLYSQSGAKGCVFEVKTAKGVKFYLAGSVHELRKQDHPIPSSYYKVFEKSDLLVMEADMDQMLSPEAMMQVQMLGMNMDGKPLSDILPARVYQKVKKWQTKEGMDILPIDQFKPWMLAMTVNLLAFQKIGVTAEQGVESVFNGLAKKKSMKVKSFETVEQQVGFLDQLSADMQVHFLDSTLDDLSQATELFDNLLKHWRNGEIDELVKLSGRKDMTDMDYQLIDIILNKRNQTWVQAILQDGFFEGANMPMILVGAAHLGGNKGLVSLLKKAGCEVRGVE
jgi:uncharacterized protein